MTDAASSPMEDILRHCEAAAPNPWYPSDHARSTGISRDSLDPLLNDLRVGGLIRLTDWVKGHGQGYVLTPLGEEVLKNPRALSQLRTGKVPQPAPAAVAPSEPSTAERPWARGDSVRDAIFTATPPTISFLLIGANLLFFVYGMILAWHLGVPLEQVFSTNSDHEVLQRSGSLMALNLARGEWWRLLTNCFVHVGFLHLFLNMFGLLMIGPLLERMWGHGRFLLLYLVSGLGGSCAAMIFKPMDLQTGRPINLAGASGAICGLMASAAVWLLLNRHHLRRPVVSSMMRSILFNLVFIAIISTDPRVSGLAHYGGAAVGSLFSLILNVERYGSGWMRVLAFLGLWVVPATCLGWLDVTMKTSAPWQLIMQRERVVKTDTERSDEQKRIERESNEFNEEYLPKIEERIRAARKLYLGQSVILLNEPPRDPTEPGIKKSVQTLTRERTALTELAAVLRKAGPYETATLEKARKTGFQYLEGWAKVLEMTETLLQSDKNWAMKKEALAQQYRQVGEIGQTWRDLLRPKS